MNFVVVGFRFRNTAPEVLNEGTITLENEPDNPYDSMAVKVLVSGVHVGYVSRENCAMVKSVLDSGVQFSVEVTAIYPGSAYCVIVPV